MSANSSQELAHAAERSFFAVVLGLAGVSWVGLLLAQAGFLGVGSLAGATAALWFVCRRLAPSRRLEPEGGEADGAGITPAVPLAVLLVVAGAMFTPPFQTTLWAGDATIYVGYGVHIGRTGSFMFGDSLLQAMPVERRRELFRNQTPDDLTGQFARLPGGIAVADVDTSRVAAGFAPLFPILIAIFSQLFGAAAVFWVAPLLGMGGVAAVFFLGRALGGSAAGFIAGLMLAVSMPQIWFSRISMSEIAAQFFLIGGAWMALLFLRSKSRRIAVASGFVLGVAGLTGLDVLVAETIAIVTFAALAMATGRRVAEGRLFVAAFGAVAAHSVAHLIYYPSNYTQFFALRLQRLPFSEVLIDAAGTPVYGRLLALGAAGVGSAAIVALLVARAGRGAPERQRQILGLAICAVVGIGFAVYLVPLRPRLLLTVAWLAAYLSWPLLLLFGAVVLGTLTVRVRRGGQPDVALLLSAFVIGSVPIMYNPQLQDVGIHLGTMRRFIPFAIPGVLLVASAGLVWLAGRTSLTLRRLALPATATLLIVLVGWPGWGLVRVPYWNDGLRQSDALAALFPDDAVVLVSAELAGTHVQATLTLYYGLSGLVLFPNYAQPGVLEDQIVDWLGDGREVFLLASDDGVHFQAPAIGLTEVGESEIVLRVLEDSAPPPRRVHVRSTLMSVYRAYRVDGVTESVDVGRYSSDAVFRLEGFFGAEQDELGRYRWTGPRSSIELPARAKIALVVAGARPSGVPPASISIWVGSRKLVEDRILADAPERIVLDIGEQTGASITIRIESSSFNPQAAVLSGDTRDLGVRVYEVDLNPRDLP